MTAIIIATLAVLAVCEFIRANDVLMESNAFLHKRLRDTILPPSATGSPIHDALVIDLFKVAGGMDDEGREWTW